MSFHKSHSYLELYRQSSRILVDAKAARYELVKNTIGYHYENLLPRDESSELEDGPISEIHLAQYSAQGTLCLSTPSPDLLASPVFYEPIWA